MRSPMQHLLQHDEGDMQPQKRPGVARPFARQPLKSDDLTLVWQCRGRR
jgi:hypothetical protein